MQQVKIDEPDTWKFETRLPIRVDDINYGGHLGNEAVLTIAQEARIQFLQEGGFSERNIGGPGLIMTGAAVQYRAEGHHGDVMSVKIQPTGVEKSGFDLIYRMKRTNSQELLSMMKTGMRAYDYEREEVVRLPDPFRSFLTS